MYKDLKCVAVHQWLLVSIVGVIICVIIGVIIGVNREKKSQGRLGI